MGQVHTNQILHINTHRALLLMFFLRCSEVTWNNLLMVASGCYCCFCFCCWRWWCCWRGYTSIQIFPHISRFFGTDGTVISIPLINDVSWMSHNISPYCHISWLVLLFVLVFHLAAFLARPSHSVSPVCERWRCRQPRWNPRVPQAAVGCTMLHHGQVGKPTARVESLGDFGIET